MFLKRVQKMQAELSDAGVGFAVIVPGANFRYLTGHAMKLSERVTMLVVPAEGPPALAAPLLEAGGLAEMCGIEDIFTYRDGESPVDPFRRLVDASDLSGPVGCEFTGLRMLERDVVSKAIPETDYCDITGIMGRLRGVKDESELEAMEEAVEIVEGVFCDVQDSIAPGVTEAELAQEVKMGLAERGSGLVYTGSVASGERSALPHAGPSARTLQNGDLVWFDVCAEYGGYHSDLTRTFGVGDIASDLREAYEVVYRAQARAREDIVPGMAAEDVDALCRRYIEDAGYGEYFTHRTGHGLGLEIHEPPYMVSGDTTILTPGTTFTVEPGIYLPGRGGVRIEDDVVVTQEGCRSLTTYPRNLLPDD